jgi:hypothetical protein
MPRFAMSFDRLRRARTFVRWADLRRLNRSGGAVLARPKYDSPSIASSSNGKDELMIRSLLRSK